MGARFQSACLIMVCVILGRVDSVPISQFYPFGSLTGDQILGPGDDISSNEIRLEENVVFFNTSYRTIYVNLNGHVSFDTEVPDYRAELEIPLNLPVIAVLFADVDTRGTGQVFYRATSDASLIQRAAKDIRAVSWRILLLHTLVNTFQLVITTNGKDSFAFFHYLDNGIQWTSSQGKFVPLYNDKPAQAGIDGGEGLFYKLPGSADTVSFVNGSNVNIPGVWMFQIGNTGRGNIRPADYSIAEVTVFDVDAAGKDSCFQTSNICHANAQCIDHRGGVCCVCVPPHFGNGFHCLEPGVPQKLNGPVHGSLNGVALDDNLLMHTYVVTADGRTYSAISKVPPTLGAGLQTLNSIGGVIGWLFAVPMNARAKNGYTFTGGIFNRTARITFKSADRGDYVVRLYQVFSGHDSQNNILMETRLEGNMPDIPIGATVSVDDYNENYKRTAPGTIKSFVARTYRVNDVAYQYSWDNTITFNECDTGEFTSTNDVMRLSVSRHYVKHSEQDKVVRYAMTSKVGLFAGTDPCSEASQVCAENADCVPLGDSYRCVCKTGYSGDGRLCEDVDECQMRTCDPNAQCYNLPGSFQCRCSPGYSGDGRVCRADVRLCGQNVCDRHARCTYAPDTQQPRCECNPGFQGDGVRCAATEVSCNEADICGDNAECLYDENLRQYYCECMDEFSGDGFSCEKTTNGCSDCDRFAQCVLDSSRNTYVCQCDAGYTGNGHQCTLIDTCADCDANARCSFIEEESDYQCICVRGYKGDGKTCELRDCREDPTMCDSKGSICWLDVDRNISICRCNYGYRAAPQPGCDVAYDCDVNARCVPDAASPSRFTCKCNPGYHGDGKVCLQRFVPCNQVNNCDRNAECLYDPDILSYTCRCSRGYEGDGLVCTRREIIDCRRNPGLCSADAECVQGAEEGYVCVCRPGFRGDGASCSPVVREGNYLIYAQGTKVMRVSTDPRPGDYGQQLVYIPGSLAVGVDIDCQEGDIYWTDAAIGVIRRAKLNGSGVEVIVTGLKSPEGVAVDFVARNLFFTDSELDILQVSRLDGSNRKTLVSTDMVNPRAVVLDINRGVVFWTDWNRNRPQIEKISMDGSQRMVLVEQDLRLPNGLAFDTFSQTLCWGDAGTHSIECIRSDGIGRRVVYDKAAYPFDIVVLNNIVYWTDWERKDIPNINQSGGETNKPLTQAIGGNGRLYGITAVKDQCPRARNPCGLNNGGCKFLCLASANGGRVCSCPDGVDPRICQQ
ncbi:unnamed protein product [Candidula unifasciata]|uniref:Nidogen n=1 Tax=Candidula unifasciata TaxID=100452 RepID=A0A8S3Z429_9EUPU|nr:unnamed protein product [Candidula unifasciata]